MSRRRFLRVLLPAALVSIAAAQPVTFNYTGGVQTYTVPPSVSQLTIDASGAQGGGGVFGFAN